MDNHSKPFNIRSLIKYDGKLWGICYLSIDDFENELSKLGEILDYIEENYGKIVAIIPNIGLTSTSIILGTSFQGVKGFAIVYSKYASKHQ